MTKIISNIKTLEDRQKLLDDLQSLITWTENNAMQFNEDKFQLQQIGSDEQLKLPYEFNNIKLPKSEHVRDLGVHISEDLCYKHQITEMVKSATNFASWTMRTFRTRDQDVMLLLLKTYIIPRLEYLSPIWTPHKIGEIQQIEAVQRSFTSRIKGLENDDYYQRLQKLKLYSLQRRRERYVLIHTYKIYLNLAPNDLNLQFQHHPRLGLQCRRKMIKTKVAKIQTLRFNFFSHYAPRLFNIIPAKIKTEKTINSFKYKLDKMLKMLPDTPPTKGYPRVNNNSLTEWVGHIQRASVEMSTGSGDLEQPGGADLDNTVDPHSRH